MSERTARTVVNDLIETCRDGARGFRNAAGLVADRGIEALLLEMADERSEFAAELERHAQRLGGGAASQGTAAAAVHRGWMDLKSALTSHDDQAVLAEVCRGDGMTLRVFANAIAGLVPPTIREVVEAQDKQIRVDHARLEDVMRAGGAHTG